MIKVEPPQGDETRTWGPPFLGDAASYFIGVNRNKRGIALDLAKPDGRVVLLGDACHPVPPYMAAGGAMAVEDAAILSRCLTTFDDRKEAFASYMATRIPRVADVQRISLENSWMRGPTDTDWFYCYDPCTAPLKPPL